MVAKSQVTTRAAEHNAVYRPRLNPFAFPSDTTFRFVLLIVSILGASLFIYQMLYYSVPRLSQQLLNTYSRCYDLAGPVPVGPITDEAALAASFARNAIFNQCIAPVQRQIASCMLGGVLLLLAVAGVIYWNFPRWKIRRDELVPVRAEDAPEVVAYLVSLCREAGLVRPPLFLWNPLNLSRTGLAFGRYGSYYIAISGGLVTQFYTDQPAFRAVMLHELAHLRNADVNKTYFTIAIWWAFVITALLPIVVVTILQFLGIGTSPSSLDVLFALGWRVLVMAVLVFLIRNAILRAREVYADVRASVWDTPAGGLRRVLESLPSLKGRRWRELVATHPDPDERRYVVDEPQRLFHLGFLDAFGAGVAAAVAYPNVISLLSFATTGMQVSGISHLGATLIFAPLAVGVVGLGTWRGAFAALVQGERPYAAGRLGIGLGLGFVLGQPLALQSAIQFRDTSELLGSFGASRVS
jgi:Zn-dependent protease with chaperone function